MKKATLILAAVILFNNLGYTQKGKNLISIGVEYALPMDGFGDVMDAGFGASAKGYYGTGAAGQFSVTAGFASFSEKNRTSLKGEASIIPLLAGYRHNLNSFYMEPQIGYGIYKSSAVISGTKVQNSVGAFTWAAGLGYSFRGVDLSTRYQSGAKDGTRTNLFAIRLAYNIAIGNSF